jgi:hypothetical protein
MWPLARCKIERGCCLKPLRLTIKLHEAKTGAALICHSRWHVVYVCIAQGPRCICVLHGLSMCLRSTMPSSNFKHFLLLLVLFLLYQSWRSRIADARQYRVTPWMPGVGVSLTAHYAVVSIRKEDGSFEDVGRVEGSEAYVGMMRRYGAGGMGYTR